MLFDSSPRCRRQTVISSLLLGATLLWCNSSQAAGAEEPRWYDVEVIIFSQNSQQYRDSEMWPVDYDLPQMETTQELLPAPANPAPGKATAPVPFSRLDEQSLRLTAQAERINTAPDMELLLHLGWRQPGLAEDKAIAVRVDDGMQEPKEKPAATGQQQQLAVSGAGEGYLPAGDAPHRMEGTLKLVLSRYLHIYTDLIYREPLSDTAISAETPLGGGTEPDLFSLAENSFSVPLQPRYQVYHLQQSRRMRSRELHYLDHPLFGMAILVTPYEFKETTGANTVPAP